MELRVGQEHHAAGAAVSREGDTALHESACNAVATKFRRNGELGELELVGRTWQDGTRAYHGVLAERDEDLPAGIDEVRMGIGQLRLVGVFHEAVLVEPRTIQLGEARDVF